MQVIRGILLGAVVGMVLGVLARALMRLVAIGMGIEPEFHVGASIAIVSLFVVSCAGAGAARVLGLRGWRRVLALVASAVPLLLMGSVFAIGEIGEVLDRDLALPGTVGLLALASVILGIVLVTPYAGWRAGVALHPGRARL